MSSSSTTPRGRNESKEAFRDYGPGETSLALASYCCYHACHWRSQMCSTRSCTPPVDQSFSRSVHHTAQIGGPGRKNHSFVEAECDFTRYCTPLCVTGRKNTLLRSLSSRRYKDTPDKTGRCYSRCTPLRRVIRCPGKTLEQVDAERPDPTAAVFTRLPP